MLSAVESKAGQDCRSPEDCRPNSNRVAKESRHDDSEKEACVDAKQESGPAGESEHENQAKRVKLSSLFDEGRGSG